MADTSIQDFEKKFDFLPVEMRFISTRKLIHYCRLIKNPFDDDTIYQIITEDFVLYHGRWPDVICNSLKEANEIAVDKAKMFMQEWVSCDDDGNEIF